MTYLETPEMVQSSETAIHLMQILRKLGWYSEHPCQAFVQITQLVEMKLNQCESLSLFPWFLYYPTFQW